MENAERDEAGRSSGQEEACGKRGEHRNRSVGYICETPAVSLGILQSRCIVLVVHASSVRTWSLFLGDMSPERLVVLDRPHTVVPSCRSIPYMCTSLYVTCDIIPEMEV